MNKLIPEFINEYYKIDNSIDREKTTTLIKNAYKPNSYQKDLEKRWYDSLLTDEVDYSVYNDQYYFTDIFYCWFTYSRKYIQLLDTLKLKPNSVIDIGNGIGYSTRQLKTIYPDARIIGFNMKDTKQYEFCEYYSNKYNYEMIDSLDKIDTCDLLFVSEFLEHIKSPLEYIDKFVKLKPKYMVIASSFNTYSVGHFTSYLIDGNEVNEKQVSRIVNNYIRSKGYVKEKTGFWNNKPSIWKIE